jgi:hypothetical protein
MGTVHVREHAAFPPDVLVAALTDFGPDRGEIFGNSETVHLQVHDRGDTWADVTEGSRAGGGIWQRMRYDWSTPGEVRLDVTDSNAFGPGSRWTYRLAPTDDGGTDIDLRIVRVPSTGKGRLVDAALRLGGGVFFRRDLRRTVRTLESRTSPAP